jgi:hypothetical protein
MSPVNEWQYCIVSRVDEAGLPRAEPAEYVRRGADGSADILTADGTWVSTDLLRRVDDGDVPGVSVRSVDEASMARSIRALVMDGRLSRPPDEPPVTMRSDWRYVVLVHSDTGLSRAQIHLVQAESTEIVLDHVWLAREDRNGVLHNCQLVTEQGEWADSPALLEGSRGGGTQEPVEVTPEVFCTLARKLVITGRLQRLPPELPD